MNNTPDTQDLTSTFTGFALEESAEYQQWIAKHEYEQSLIDQGS